MEQGSLVEMGIQLDAKERHSKCFSTKQKEMIVSLKLVLLTGRE